MSQPELETLAEKINRKHKWLAGNVHRVKTGGPHKKREQLIKNLQEYDARRTKEGFEKIYKKQ